MTNPILSAVSPTEDVVVFFQNNLIQTVDIYVDGACSGNPGPGGWGVLFVHEDQQCVLSGGDGLTTNNRMELIAAIEALKVVPSAVDCIITTDSQYVKDGITSWIDGWKKRNWMNSKGDPVKNQDLWKELDALRSNRSIQWKWVKGHSGHAFNDYVDMLAKRAIIALQMK